MQSTKTQFLVLLVFTVFFFVLSPQFFLPTEKIVEDSSTDNISSPTPTETEVEDSSVEIILTGDVMLGRSVMKKALELNDYSYPFVKVAPELSKADLVFINLENPIVKNCPIHEGGFKFCSPPESIEALLYAGVDVVSLANNHSGNYGEKGIEETVNYLENKGILVTGVGSLVIKEIGEMKFGFLGFDKAQQTNPILTPIETDLIKDSDSKVDILVVAMHWGVEYQNKALPGVRSLANQLVKTGADIVVGHHPHWVQDIECFEISQGVKESTPPVWTSFAPQVNGCPKGSKIVYYSLGNFVFDQMWSEETKKGLAVRLTFGGKDIINQELLPIYISSVGQPEFVK
ncbi:hypothetical protein A2771_03970 [Candidatus Woesebacteria bacterium RIFCSPHIGHO2_01_FULL_38_26b]|uniref:Capsule synthesis protein CapA domain-containing protein n=1 Tax=Candidatus Woesebacteria bacterium RIFCSPHIGHO2_01_FULL_38_26b TaxID=1802491 RepID=A0A1F7XW41_9BACT|nr:MAG: hypothetical protein A2771_03970 [Candidatus Woesebacteria bacterium RIFCSPHIGHO2_01_FULL_38_26b]